MRVDESNRSQICVYVDLCRYGDPFVMVNFDGDPKADSEQYIKLERSVPGECESRVSCISFVFSFLILNFVVTYVSMLMWMCVCT